MAPAALPPKSHLTPRAFVVFLAAVTPRFAPTSVAGRAQTKLAAFAASTPGTALITLAAAMAILIASCAGVLTIARSADSLTLLMVLIYSFLIISMGMVVVAGLLLVTLAHIVLGDDLLSRMRLATVSVEPEYEWVRF